MALPGAKKGGTTPEDLPTTELGRPREACHALRVTEPNDLGMDGDVGGRLVSDSKKFNQFNHDSLDEMTDSIITQSNSLIFQAIQSRLMDLVIQLNHDSSHYQ